LPGIGIAVAVVDIRGGERIVIADEVRMILLNPVICG
jgi:hypothetical protein